MIGHTSTRNPNLDLSPAPSAPVGPSSSGLLGTDSWWTGPNPKDPHCPGRTQTGCVVSLPQIELAQASRDAVRAYFANTWVLTELLFASLQDELAFYKPPYHGLRHPLIFYYVHPAVLYINKLHVAGLLPKTLHPYYERLFETGVDEMSWDDLSKNEMDWPPLSECWAYRKAAFALVDQLIAEHPGLAPGHPPIGPDSPLWALFMGFEHERIHLETSSVLIRELPVSLVQRPEAFPPLHSTARLWRDGVSQFLEPSHTSLDGAWMSFEEGTVRIGKSREFPSYGWDNEYGQAVREVARFACTEHLITNAEFYSFVRDGAYREERWWTPDGWAWRTFRNVKWPTFWVPCGPQGAHEYGLRTLFEVIEMPWDWPVVVNYHEAKAFAAWKSQQEPRGHALRLLTEAEHHRLRQNAYPTRTDQGAEAWQRHQQDHSMHVDLRIGSEAPVGVRGSGLSDVFGNVWQWLEDHFHPLQNFAVHPLYDDFSTPCFDGKHQMIMGGSFMSTGDEASLYARFHFRPHFFQHAGFRLVDPLSHHNDGCAVLLRQDEETAAEHDRQRLAARAWSAFASVKDLSLPGVVLPIATRESLLNVLRKAKAEGLWRKALDIGCGVGGMSYALTELAESVLGLDLSKEALQVAETWQQAAMLTCPWDTSLKHQLAPDRLTRLAWRQCDASSLPADILDYDLVLLSQTLSRLPSPRSALSRMSGERALVRKGGFFLLVDAFHWSEAHTPRSLWIKPDKAELQEVLGKNFQPIADGVCHQVERLGPHTLQIEQLSYSLWRREG